MGILKPHVNRTLAQIPALTKMQIIIWHMGWIGTYFKTTKPVVQAYSTT